MLQAIVLAGAYRTPNERTNEWKTELMTPHLQSRELSIIYIIENEEIPSLISLCGKIDVDVDRRKKHNLENNEIGGVRRAE